MLTSNKKLIKESEQQRQGHTNYLNHLKHIKDQRKYQQLMVGNQYLDNSKYSTVLNKDILKYFCRANDKNNWKLDIYFDYKFLLAKELLDLNFIKIIDKKSHYLIFSTTKLGKKLFKTLHYNTYRNDLKSKTNHYWKMSKIASTVAYSIIGITAIMVIISIPLNLIFLSLLFFCLMFCSVPIASVADNNRNKYNKLMSKSVNINICNKKALLALKKLLTPNEYSQEFKMFKKYAKKD